MNATDVLIPTRDRHAALAVTLTSLIAQTDRDFRVVVSDQGERPAEAAGEVRAAARVLGAQGVRVEFHRHLPARGMAEQRDFLLSHVRAPRALFLDDDLILEGWVLATMRASLDRLGCGFVGMAVLGLSYAHDERPHQQRVEFWNGPVTPEVVVPDSPEWERYPLHNAANVWHVQRRLGLTKDTARPYKVAWVGGCTLYDTRALRDAGGFSFWRDLPEAHCGEDVLAQQRVMAARGGCGLMPSGVYHQELPTTVPDRRVNAPRVLPLRPDAPATR